MLPSVIAQIFARLFAIKWLLTSLGLCVTIFLSTAQESYFSKSALYNLLPTGVLMIGAAILWFSGPAIGRALARGADAPVNLSGITQQQLFSAVLFGLGFYFALANLSGFLQVLYYLSDAANRADLSQYSGGSYQMAHVIVTFMAGILLAFNCRGLARKFPVTDFPASET